MLQIDKTIKKPYYVQIYEYFRHEIEARRMQAGDRGDRLQLRESAQLWQYPLDMAVRLKNR